MSLWKNPAVVGPVAAALVAAVVAAVTLFPKSDRSPPTKPIITKISRLPDEVTRLVLEYEDARDQTDGSGLKEVRLWYRHSEKDQWIRTNWVSTAPKGEIYFDEPGVSGTYFFDLVATDQAGNSSAQPLGTAGQKRFLFQARTEVRKPQPAPKTQRKAIEKAIASTAPVEGWVHVPVHFHLIAETNEQLVERASIHQQIRALNEAFYDGKISFSVTGVSNVVDAKWHSSVVPGTNLEAVMKTSLVLSPETQLNVYGINPQGGLLGWSAFPWDLSSRRELDGCVVNYQTFPGGAATPFDEGKTLVHCVGHWLGLYHTFHGGCKGEGDYVKDTPAHKGPSWGSGQEDIACEEGQQAPINNFMNYGDDSVQTEFTTGQYIRMQKMIAAYRPGLL